MLAGFGRWLIQGCTTVAEVIGMIGDAVRKSVPLFINHPPILRIFLKQVYFTGYQTLGTIAALSLIVGAVIVGQTLNIIGTGNESLTGKLLVVIIVRELGPVLTAIIVIARSGTAIATEIGSMKVNGEIEAIEDMGIDPSDYLLTPRILGCCVAVTILSIYFESISMLGGAVTAGIGWHVSFERLLEGIQSSLTLKDLFFSGVKSACFGLFMGAICCFHGSRVTRNATQVPQAATKGVMMSLLFLFLLDSALSAVSFGWG